MFDFNLLLEESDIENTYKILVKFEGNMSLVLERYAYIILINEEEIEPRNLVIFSNNSFLMTIEFPATNNELVLSIEFSRLTYLESLMNLKKNLTIKERIASKQNIGNLSDIEYSIYNVFKDGLAVFSTQSGSIITSFSSTSLLAYFVGILWNFQISSFYLFFNVSKPENL